MHAAVRAAGGQYVPGETFVWCSRMLLVLDSSPHDVAPFSAADGFGSCNAPAACPPCTAAARAAAWRSLPGSSQPPQCWRQGRLRTHNVPLLLLLPPSLWLLFCRALAERLKWAFSDVLGGKEAFTLMLCSLVSVALPGKQLRSEERADFVRVAQTVLDGVHPLVVQHVLQLKDSLLPEACAAQEQIGAQVLLSLGAALQLLQV